MTNRKIRLLTAGSVLGWVLALLVPMLAKDWLAVEVLILVDMVILSAAITCTVLTVIARSLPPIAAAWFLGYREGSKPPRRDEGRGLRIVGD